MQWIDSEEMACNEAEHGPDEFAEKMHCQQKLQEQVKSSWILVLEVGWRWIQLNDWEYFLQQLEMLKYMRKFHLDDQSAILEKVHACAIHFLIHFSSFCSKIKMQTSFAAHILDSLTTIQLWNNESISFERDLLTSDNSFLCYTVASGDGKCQFWRWGISFVTWTNSGECSKKGFAAVSA